MALRFGCPQQKGFHAHRREGKQESHKTETRIPALCVGSQQQKKRSEKDAISGVGGNGKQNIIAGFPEGQGGDKAIIAVSSQADQIEESRCRQRKARAPAAQQKRQKGTEQNGGKVPEMIKSAVKQDSPHHILPAVQIAGIEVQRQIEQHGGQIQQTRFFEEMRQAAPFRAGKEIARYQEKEGDSQAGQYAREKEVAVRRVRCQRGGMNRGHQHSGHDPEPVQSGRF